MSFNSGTISGSATPALALMSALHTEIDGHAGWTYIEEVTSGTTTTRVYRSDSAFNTHGANFYLYLRRTDDANTSISVALSELWTTGGTGTVTYPVTTAAIAATTLTPDASGRYNGATSTGVLLANCFQPTLAVNTTSFFWLCSVTADRVVIGTLSGGSNSGVYAGAYERLYTSVIDPAPLCLMAVSGNATTVGSSAVMGFTRELSPFVSQTNNWKLYGQPATYGLGPHSVTSNTDMTTGHYVAVRILVGGATSASRANARGQLRDVLYCQPSVTANVGDTATISSVAYTCYMANAWVRNGA